VHAEHLRLYRPSRARNSDASLLQGTRPPARIRQRRQQTFYPGFYPRTTPGMISGNFTPLNDAGGA